MSTNAVEMTPAHKEALAELLFQLADDDFLLSYRGSEWLGLAPHIEEDVASSSISQDTMGHAKMYYGLLEELGYGKIDDLAHGRSAKERKNSILVERENGAGYYLETPRYDWAYAVVRNYFYTLAKKVKIDSLKKTTYQPLAEVATKVSMELFYHHLHWRTWFTQLLSSSDEAKERMNKAIDGVMADFGDVFSYGNASQSFKEFALIEDATVLKQRWEAALKEVVKALHIESPIIQQPDRNGRLGEHTEELDRALSTLSEVYRLNPAVPW